MVTSIQRRAKGHEIEYKKGEILSLCQSFILQISSNNPYLEQFLKTFQLLALNQDDSIEERTHYDYGGDQGSWP
jgi:hypothetical protein